MKIFILSALLILAVNFAGAQETSALAPNATNLLGSLLNNPALVTPADVEPLGNNWFRLRADAHVFTDKVTAKQVVGVLRDIKNADKIYDGKRSKLHASIVRQAEDGGVIVNFVSISVAGIIQIRTPYCAKVTELAASASKITIEIKQTSEDSTNNTEIKGLYGTRYTEDVTINGKVYTYIRLYTTYQVNASILPDAKSVLEQGAESINTEVLQLIINAAETVK